MDINTLRIIVELASFATFASIVAWAWSARRQKDFECAAHLPFDAEEEELRSHHG